MANCSLSVMNVFQPAGAGKTVGKEIGEGDAITNVRTLGQ